VRLDGVTIDVRDVDGRLLASVSRGTVTVWRCALCDDGGEESNWQNVGLVVTDICDHLIGAH
jgi:hypothetical protein